MRVELPYSICEITYVASVSVRFGSKERPGNGIFGIFPARNSLLPNRTETLATQATGETAFSQEGLFLDKPFPGITLRYFFITIRSFHFFWILLKVYLTITKAREKLTKRGFNRTNSHSEKCIKGTATPLAEPRSQGLFPGFGGGGGRSWELGWCFLHFPRVLKCQLCFITM